MGFGAGGESDPHWTSVVLLMNFNGNLTDSSLTGHTVTDRGTITFGADGAILDGSTDYADMPDHADFAFGSGDYTIEVLCNNQGTDTESYRTVLAQGDSSVTSSTIGFSIQPHATPISAPRALTYTDSVLEVTAGTTDFNGDSADRNVTFVRDGDTQRLYIDGVEEGTNAVTGSNVDGSNKIAIGRPGENDGSYWSGTIRAIRITKGVCRYPDGTTFTPPSWPLPTS